MVSDSMLSRVSPPNSKNGSRCRVIVIDDHPAILEAISEILNTKMDLQLVGKTTEGKGVFDLVENLQPDVAVIDIGLKDAHGLDLLQNLHAQYPHLKVVIFSMYDETVYAERAIRAGALGYVMKSEPTQTVVEAIRVVAQGDVYLSRHIASRMLSKLAIGNVSGPSYALEELTDREMAVFQLIGQGYSTEEIAQLLHLNRKTVETYRRRCKEKLGLDSISELLQFALQWNYGNPAYQ